MGCRNNKNPLMRRGFECLLHSGHFKFFNGNRMTGNGAISKDFAYPALNYILDRGSVLQRKGERVRGIIMVHDHFLLLLLSFYHLLFLRNTWPVWMTGFTRTFSAYFADAYVPQNQSISLYFLRCLSDIFFLATKILLD